ncbi:PREDICTED: transcription factor A, mitochondrial [Chinchilla lanigera]|uniref:Transcription factor A, mitochondrial n=1 Tax=Chinchilla lanigera TaxID=34839 RepID=A0A8C2VEP7_CHILA|nr:PREDICTED: transcription factor A, mitochondrial [Chinchilla lanigera]
MALLRGVWGVLRALGRSGAELCAGCGSRLRSPFSIVYVPKWFSSTLNGYPKKPVNSYIRFTKEKMSILKAQNPDKKVTEIMKRIAEQWKELPAAEKKMYEDAYKVEWEAYKEEMKRINEALTPAQRASLAENKAQRRLKRKGIMKKKELSMLGKPKKARTAYNIFLSEYVQDCEGATIQAKWKCARENWNNMSGSQKQVYEQLAQDDRIRYNNEIKAWEEQMIEVGRSDVVRRKTYLQNRMTKDKED